MGQSCWTNRNSTLLSPPQRKEDRMVFQKHSMKCTTVQASLLCFLPYSLPWNVKRSEHDYLSLSLGKRIQLQINGTHSLIYESHIPPNSSQKHHESIWCPSVTFCIWLSLKIFKTNRTRPKMFLCCWRVTHWLLLSWVSGMQSILYNSSALNEM